MALSQSLPKASYVINLHADRYLYLRAFCAALVAGQCTLMPPNRQSYTLEQLKSVYDDAYTVGEDGEEAVEPGPFMGIPEIPDKQHSAIAFTSGSTGSPSPNLKYWRTLRDGALSNVETVLDTQEERLNVVATVPPQHMWGMETSIMLPLFANLAISNLMPFFPQNIADALQGLPEPRMLVSSPIHLEAFLRSGVETVAIEKIITATAPLSKQLAQDLENGFDTHVKDVFGCSESGILAARRTSVDEEWAYSNTFKLTMTDDGVRISAAHLSEDVMLPDIVRLTGPSSFRWMGRQLDMVNIAGKRGSLADLNFRLQEIPGVVDGVIFEPADDQRRGDRLAALVVAPDLEVSDILTALRDKVETVFLPRPMIKVPVLPRQETGKLATKAVREMFARMRDDH